MPSEVSLRSATSFSIASTSTAPSTLRKSSAFYLGPIAVADRIDEEVAQSMPLEQFAEHVVDLAAERGARLFQLFEQPPINLALAGVCGA